jgi:two-component system chemotaxis sensor kinase CheA
MANRGPIQEFVSEAKEHLANITDDLLGLERERAESLHYRLDRIFRAVHSVKGGAGFFGCKTIERIAHQMETLLDLARSRTEPPDAAWIDGLLAGADRIVGLLDDLAGEPSADIDELLAHFERLCRIYEPPSPPPPRFLPDDPALNALPAGHDHVYEITVELGECFRREGESPLSLLGRLQGLGHILDAHLSVPEGDLTEQLPRGPLWYQALLSSSLAEADLLRALGLRTASVRLVQGPPAPVVVQVQARPDAASQPSEPEPSQPAELIAAAPTIAPTPTPAPATAAAAGALAVPTPTPPAATLGRPVPSAQVNADLAGQLVGDAEGEAAGSSAAGTSARSVERGSSTSTIRIPVALVDQLMTLAGELVLVRNQATRVLNEHHTQDDLDTLFRPIVQRLDLVTGGMQEAVIRMRMQPVGILFNKFPRLVRDLARQLDKQIELTIQGTEVELDKTILEALSDPLTHLIRNCCDHGIEPPGVRVAAGKPATGTITLSAQHIGGQIAIEVRDDGRGIDLEAVRRKALAVGLRTAQELARLSEKELYSLILLPGFSTATAVTDVSGRGVGMDVVKTNLDRLSGVLEIESQFGRGTVFKLRLPLTLAIIPCLLVAVHSERFAIPQKDLEELVCLYGEELLTRVEYAFDQEVIRLRDRLVPLVRLSDIISQPRPFTPAVRAELVRKHRPKLMSHTAKSGEEAGYAVPVPMYVAVLRAGSKRYGLIVDRILNTEEIVVKPMHAALKRLGCFSGATILGDGRVALILSTEGLARHAGISFDNEPRPAPSRRVADTSELQTVLLFRYGPHEQFAMPLAMIRRLEPIRMNRIERIGQQEFITSEGESIFIVRLDHYLSVSRCEDRSEMLLLLPKYVRRRPIGILLSEVIDTELLNVRLSTAAIRADGLVGTAIVRNQMTLFLDVYRLADLIEPQQKAPPMISRADRKRVLVVEDTQFFQHLVRSYLETAGYEVVMASNGQEALAYLEQDRDFDLIVSDIEMPLMDGWALARAIRANPRLAKLPLVALTTLSSEQDRAKALECGFDQHEVKVDRERFLAMVARMTQSRSKP